MANSLIIKSSGTITDVSQPTAKRDRLLNSGSIFMYDLARPFCVDLTVTPVEGATVNNLVAGAPAAILKVPTAGDLVAVAGKGIRLKATTNKGRIQLGAPTDFFQANLGHDFLIISWVTFPASDPGGGHIGMIFSKGADSAVYAPVGPWLAARYVGSGGNPDQQGKFDSSGTNGVTINSANTEPDPVSPAGLHQFAMAKIGANVQFYRDGVAIGAAQAWSAGSPLAANSNPFDWGNHATNEIAPRGMILHRILAEDLTVSGKTAAAQVAADYSQNTGRFV